MALEKSLESPLDSKEIKPINPKRNLSWIFTRRTDAEAEASILWPDVKSWFIRKYPDAGKDWRQEKWMTEDEMVGWHHWLNGHGFDQALGVGDEQGRLACCSPWGRKELDTTERLNWTEDACICFPSSPFALSLCLTLYKVKMPGREMKKVILLNIAQVLFS